MPSSCHELAATATRRIVRAVHHPASRLVSFSLFLVGFVIVIAGVAWGLKVAGLSTTWIMITCLILLGIGILTGVTRTRPKDPPA
jgi:amino acid transporter